MQEGGRGTCNRGKKNQRENQAFEFLCISWKGIMFRGASKLRGNFSEKGGKEGDGSIRILANPVISPPFKYSEVHTFRSDRCVLTAIHCI